ncbi:MAG: polysaccharide biosynthesis/export family protein [Rhodomicrobiaceae bacterium]
MAAIFKSFRHSAILLLALFAASLPAHARDYFLGPKDKLSIKVFEVRASTGEIFAWEPLTGEFTVGPDGEISLPLLGRIAATGKTAGELSNIISAEMKSRIGLVSPPVVALEIAEYRPFFIVGDVTNSGAYPFQPDLTVLQALGIAGGLSRLQDVGLLALRRDVVTQEGALQQLSAELYATLARRARLQAELDTETQPDIQWPPELEAAKDNPDIAKLLDQERKIFDARRNALKTNGSALENLKKSVESEIASLEGQLVAHKREQEVIKKDLDNIASLVDKGLAASPRKTALERIVAQLEGERWQLQTALLKARQELGRTDILALEARNTWSKEVTALLRETEAKLDDVKTRFRTARQILSETKPLVGGALSAANQAEDTGPDFSIVRMKDGEPTTIRATDSTFVEPGDTIKVTVPEPQLGLFGQTGALGLLPSN